MALPNEQQAFRPLSSDEMEFVTGGFLVVPPIHGGPIPVPYHPKTPILPHPLPVTPLSPILN
jgi:hypothetical protein